MALHSPDIRPYIVDLDPTELAVQAAVGNTILANCGVRQADVDYINQFGIKSHLQSQANAKFTLVHSTSIEQAEEIAEYGYDLATDNPSPFASSFVPVVPSEYPHADVLNDISLGYRYLGKNTKLVFQFPFPFPKSALPPSDARMLFGHTPLNKYDVIKTGLLEESAYGTWKIPASYLLGTFNLDDKTSTLRLTPSVFDRLRRASKTIFRVSYALNSSVIII